MTSENLLIVTEGLVKFATISSTLTLCSDFMIAATRLPNTFFFFTGSVKNCLYFHGLRDGNASLSSFDVGLPTRRFARFCFLEF